MFFKNIFFKTKLIGALTAKQFVFSARFWELKTFFTVDFTTSFCFDLIVFVKNFKLIRISSLIKNEKFFFWITNNVKLLCSVNNDYRLLTPFVLTSFFVNCVFDFFFFFRCNFFFCCNFIKINLFKDKLFLFERCFKSNKYLPISWFFVLFVIKIFFYNCYLCFNRYFLFCFNFGFFFDKSMDLESLYVLKSFFKFIGFFFFDLSKKYMLTDYFYVLTNYYVLTKRFLLKHDNFKVFNKSFLFLNIKFNNFLYFLLDYNLYKNDIFYFGLSFDNLLFNSFINLGFCLNKLLFFLHGKIFFCLRFFKDLSFFCFLGINFFNSFFCYIFFFNVFNFVCKIKNFFFLLNKNISVLKCLFISRSTIFLDFDYFFIFGCYVFITNTVIFFKSIFFFSFYSLLVSQFYVFKNDIFLFYFSFLTLSNKFYLVNELGFITQSNLFLLKNEKLLSFKIYEKLFFFKFDEFFEVNFFDNVYKFVFMFTSFGFLKQDNFMFVSMKNNIIKMFLPVTTFLEQSVTLINCWGIFKLLKTISFPLFRIKNKWQFGVVLCSLLFLSFKTVLFKNILILRKCIRDFVPSFYIYSVFCYFKNMFFVNFSKIFFFCYYNLKKLNLFDINICRLFFFEY